MQNTAYPPDSDLSLVFRGISDTIALNGLRALSLDFRSSMRTARSMTVDQVVLAFKQFAALTHLCLYGVRTCVILDVLGCLDCTFARDGQAAYCVHSGTDSSVAALSLFPHLQSVVVRDANTDDYDELPDDAPWHAQLLRSLQCRHVVNARLHLLDVARCTFDEQKVRQFHELVDEVVWDGGLGEVDGDYEFEEHSDVWEHRKGDPDDGSEASDELSDKSSPEGLDQPWLTPSVFAYS
ncbi:hypothetical protein BV25DRAFT_1990441 [Artomyces pyxidatus]|uniref:Uncharacterized protein n=1 Tax=Artomyces pyxidatus TaxID=48021 RepID=A0ACB8T6U9_9AGAM|nr:hypothetical protein BV25DRAFT_1990441 [Artomyces pyxidatus]